MSVSNFSTFIKSPRSRRNFSLIFIVILACLASFLLGRLSQLDREPVRLEQRNAESAIVIGSKTGKKYHLPWCAGAQTISGENKVQFASAYAARAAGFTAAANCRGLE